MSIRCLENITHNGVMYHREDIITEITKEDANRLIDLSAAIKIDDKFKVGSNDLKKVYYNRYKRNKAKEMECGYGF